jgi:hypothetical protein
MKWNAIDEVPIAPGQEGWTRPKGADGVVV